MNYISKLLELLASRKFQVTATGVFAAYEIWNSTPKTPETGIAFMVTLVGLIINWVNGQAKVDAAKAQLPQNTTNGG